MNRTSLESVRLLQSLFACLALASTSAVAQDAPAPAAPPPTTAPAASTTAEPAKERVKLDKSPSAEAPTLEELPVEVLPDKVEEPEPPPGLLLVRGDIRADGLDRVIGDCRVGSERESQPAGDRGVLVGEPHGQKAQTEQRQEDLLLGVDLEEDLRKGQESAGTFRLRFG